MTIFDLTDLDIGYKLPFLGHARTRGTVQGVNFIKSFRPYGSVRFKLLKEPLYVKILGV